MERTPIYQTRSTRVLYYHRSHKAIAFYLLAGGMLVVFGALLGHGLSFARHAPLPVTPASAVTNVHEAVIDQLVTTPTRLPDAGGPPVVVVAHGDAPAVQPMTKANSVSSGAGQSPTADAPMTHPSQWQVANTGGLGLCLRPDHDLTSRPIRVLSEGTRLTALEVTPFAGGGGWWHVSTADGATGWVARDYLIRPQ